MYVNAKDAGQVVVIDTDKDAVIGRFPVAPAGIPAALAIDERNHRLFVGCRRDPSLVVLDSDSGKVVDRVPIPGDVDDISFDARRGRVYASCGDGALAVIRQLDADHYKALGTISTVKGARTSVFDATNGQLYLAVPRLLERPEQENPEVWVYRARP
jgi:DNA-binding beta-propeller fold protein YncE